MLLLPRVAPDVRLHHQPHVDVRLQASRHHLLPPVRHQVDVVIDERVHIVELLEVLQPVQVLEVLSN